MAVENKYVYSPTAAGKKGQALQTNGTNILTMVATIAVAAADDDGSVYRCFPDIPQNAVPIEICIHNTAITSGTAYHVGIYKTNLGAVVDNDVLAASVDMSSARTVATWNNAGMTSIAIANGAQTLGVLSAQTTPDPSYDIAVTAATVGSAAGTIRVTARFALV